MATAARAPRDPRQDLISAVTALRLLVDGWRDGVVDARPGTEDGEQLRRHVGTLTEIAGDLAPVVDPAPGPS